MPPDHSIRNSLLWAAWGDALGFPAELVDESGLSRRTGRTRLETPVEWTRNVGGRGGVTLSIPAGAYSDDTQLRIATARAIRGDGSFSIDDFTRIELPVWQAYALGGGRTVKAAAGAFARASADWVDLVFRVSKISYLSAGGNGAAMRIQPHVWSSPDVRNWNSFALDVVRNSIVTHGHPRAIMGALFHAISLAQAIFSGQTPGPPDWRESVEWMKGVPGLIQEDEQLAYLWLPAWEREAKHTLSDAFETTAREMDEDILALAETTERDPAKRYEQMVEAIGATSPQSRGSGTKTALLASAVVWYFKEETQMAVVAAANRLGSDTDTIATMAGALCGALQPDPPPSAPQDQEFLFAESDRLRNLAGRRTAPSFAYPDLLNWKPPRSPLDLVGRKDDRFVLAGLGVLDPTEGEKTNGKGEIIWQWMRLPFGQTVAVKRRAQTQALPPELAPNPRGPWVALPRRDHAAKEGTLFDREEVRRESSASKGGSGRTAPTTTDRTARYDFRSVSIETLVQDVIRAQFDQQLVGHYLMALARSSENGIDRSVAFAALVAQALRNTEDRRRRQGEARR